MVKCARIACSAQLHLKARRTAPPCTLWQARTNHLLAFGRSAHPKALQCSIHLGYGIHRGGAIVGRQVGRKELVLQQQKGSVGGAPARKEGDLHIKQNRRCGNKRDLSKTVKRPRRPREASRQLCRLYTGTLASLAGLPCTIQASDGIQPPHDAHTYTRAHTHTPAQACSSPLPLW